MSHAGSARAVVDALGLERYSLLAHDSGGFIARLLAADDPRVTRIVLGDTEIPGHTPALILAYVALAKLPFGPAILRAALETRALRRSQLGLGGAFTDPAYIDGPFFDLFVRPLIESDEAAEAQLRPLRTLHHGTMDRLVEAHPRIKIPVQLIWGTRDPFFPIEKARAMTSQLGGPVSFVEIEGAKVFPHEDRAEEFLKHALDFLL